MSDLATKPNVGEAIEQVLVKGDLAALTPEQRVSYLKAVCDSVGLNYLTRPFEYITLNGKLTLYARKDCTDQLRTLHGISTAITAREVIGDVYVVTARVKRMSDGREDESTGAVPIAGLRGDNLANAYMKAETKAKRRATLSVCGLGFTDETEVETIPGARVDTTTGEVIDRTSRTAQVKARLLPQNGQDEDATLGVKAAFIARGASADKAEATVAACLRKRKIDAMSPELAAECVAKAKAGEFDKALGLAAKPAKPLKQPTLQDTLTADDMDAAVAAADTDEVPF